MRILAHQKRLFATIQATPAATTASKLNPTAHSKGPSPHVTPAAALRLAVFPQPGLPQPVPAVQVVRPGLPSLNTPPPASYALMNPDKPTWSARAKRSGLVAIKRGMSAIWDAWGVLTPVTVLQVVDCEVIKSRYNKQCGEYMVEVGAVNEHKSHRVRRPQLGHFRRVCVTPKKKLTEFRVTPDAVLPTGTKLTAMHFVPGQFVDCQAKTTGKGFQGVMKRWNFKGLRATHGVSLSHRSGGSTGMRQMPGRVIKGTKMAGRMGGKTRTVQNLKVVKIDTEQNLIFVKGAVPGPEHKYVRVSDAIRKGWHGLTFPEGAQVPFPTYTGSTKDLPRELLAPPPKSGDKDPLARARREVEK
ncbi:hypothetical protein CcCBS67573_g03794 [Chytriomyces confervae]|uniref:Large ribosomal subunit protein uL3m n=1 Tax=Chytriomyces confervae TaxID=246404 RepID=A0A507FHZ8_9FUNG|nr:54S ribosomal protein L3 [Chytriomyces hyalinus]TPX74936.1 hypothetical protein CcCBS67573_g03794 [Chytriomyces confervae]